LTTWLFFVRQGQRSPLRVCYYQRMNGHVLKELAGIATLVLVILIGGVYLVDALKVGQVTYVRDRVGLNTIASTSSEIVSTEAPAWPLPLDKKAYDERLLELVGYLPPEPETKATSSATTSIIIPSSPLIHSSTTNVTIGGKLWPPANPYPNGGAILPFNRILAYYGNFYSRQMGILGEYEPAEVLRRLAKTGADWEKADPTTPVLPAIEYIAMVAQAEGGKDGMYRAVMPTAEIEKAYTLAHDNGAILILDLQVGLSTIQRELPKFREFLIRDDVHLAIDPEFSMKYGDRPGTVIGTFSAADINYTVDYLAELVRENKLPPKVLIVHRFTQDMVTGSSKIKPQPEVQVVMNMDGWGSKELKRGSYRRVIEPEPVQFAGLKIFYKNDLKPPSTGLFTPSEVLELHPKPIYIQYQ